MHPVWSDLRCSRLLRPGADLELADCLAIVRERDPLTFPETIDALPLGFREPGLCRLVLSEHPRTVLWDGLSESAAILLAHLFETQQLVLQPCHPQLYQLAARRVELPAVIAIPAVPRQVCWLPCTISRGPLAGLNATHKVCFCAQGPST
jgi:hypothetical protein